MKPLLCTVLLPLFGCGQPFLHARPVAIPAPCIGDDSVYHLVPADTVRGFHLAKSITQVSLRDPIEGRGRVRFIVDQRGLVDTTSIVVDTASSNEYATEMVAAAAKAKFIPATRNNCAVKSWDGMGIVTVRGPSF